MRELIENRLFFKNYQKGNLSHEHYYQSKTDALMPFIQVNTSSKSVMANDDLLQKDISKTIADLTGKPENFVMTMIQKDTKMTFAGSDEPCCFIKVKSIG